jgi:hypothetical protein
VTAFSMTKTHIEEGMKEKVDCVTPPPTLRSPLLSPSLRLEP